MLQRERENRAEEDEVVGEDVLLKELLPVFSGEGGRDGGLGETVKEDGWRNMHATSAVVLNLKLQVGGDLR